MTRIAINAPDVAPPIGPFSHAVQSGDAVYLSGQTGTDAATGVLVPGDVAAQTDQVFRNLTAVLKAAGLTLEHVVKCNVFLVNMNDFNAMNTVYAKHFHAPFPARSTVAVLALPRGAQVEIEMIARKP
jgi:2-iminobutanoate/2-iminopropanoate deaminase